MGSRASGHPDHPHVLLQVCNGELGKRKRTACSFQCDRCQDVYAAHQPVLVNMGVHTYELCSSCLGHMLLGPTRSVLCTS